MAILARLWRDEAGFILSAELVLIATIAVLSLIVGLSEVSTAVNHELYDMAAAYSANDPMGKGGGKGRGGSMKYTDPVSEGGNSMYGDSGN